MTSFFLDWKSRAVCDSLIAFNRSEACAKTACLCRRSQENRDVFSPKSKLLLIPIKPGTVFLSFCLVNSQLSLEN